MMRHDTKDGGGGGGMMSRKQDAGEQGPLIGQL
jgi:hypothetical protein